MAERRVFLLSPANCGGERAQLLFSPGANFDLARRLRTRGGASLGEVMSFVSGLYFRDQAQRAKFPDRTLWSLNNAMTEAVKALRPVSRHMPNWPVLMYLATLSVVAPVSASS